MNQDQQRIHIPATIEEVAATLNGVGKLLTAKSWERAAIVYAFTRDGTHGGDRRSVSSSYRNLKSCTEFAALGIQGLRSPATVLEHRNNWKLAVENGWAVDVQPGDDAALPDEEYPPTERVNKLHDMLKSSAPVDEKVAAIRQVMERDPEVAERMDNHFIQRAGRDNTLAGKVNLAYEEFHPRPTMPERPVGELERFNLFSLGAGIYTMIQRESGLLHRLVKYIEEHPTSADAREGASIDQVIEDLEKSKQLIEQFEDRIRHAAGVDYDAVFHRLVSG